jgi:hypothetical protein
MAVAVGFTGREDGSRPADARSTFIGGASFWSRVSPQNERDDGKVAIRDWPDGLESRELPAFLLTRARS